MPSYNRYNRRNTSNGSANNGTPVSLLSEVNANLIANTIKNALPERTTVPNQVAGTVVQGIDEYNKIASGQTNNYKPSYLTDYNDPYAINSFADVLLNRDAKAKRYGDWAKTPIVGDIASTVVGAGDLLWNSTIKPILSGAQYGYEQDGLSGAVSGIGEGLATAGLNTLTNLGETMDVVANPVKAVAIEGADALGIGDFGSKYGGDVWQGFKSSLGFGGDGRVNYDWDTGNIISDLALEMISDPLNWISFGGSTATKLAAQDTLSDALTRLGVQGSDDIAQQLAPEFARAYLTSSDDLSSLMNRYFSASSNKLAFTNPAVNKLLRGRVATPDIKDFSDTLIKEITQNALKGSNQMRIGRNIYGLADKAEQALLRSVFASAGITPVYQAAKSASNKSVENLIKKINAVPDKAAAKAVKNVKDFINKTNTDPTLKKFMDSLDSDEALKDSEYLRQLYLFLKSTQDILPSSKTYVGAVEKIYNEVQFPTDPITRFVYQKITPLFKTGYLSSVGFPMRNTIDGLFRNASQLGGIENLPKATNDFVDAVKEVKEFDRIADGMLAYAQGGYRTWKNNIEIIEYADTINNSVIASYYLTHPDLPISVDDFKLLLRLKNDKSGVLGEGLGDLASLTGVDFSSTLEKSIIQQWPEDEDLSAFVADVAGIFNSDISEKSKYDTVYAMLRKQEYIPKSSRRRLYESLKAFSTLPEQYTSSLEAGQNFKTFIRNRYDSSKVKSFVSSLLEKNPILNANEDIEAGLRWSMYKQQRAMGYTHGEALNKIVDTHFVYSKKPFALKVVETYFPFTGFTLQNSKYWADMVYGKPLYTFSDAAGTISYEQWSDLIDSIKKLPKYDYRNPAEYTQAVQEIAERFLSKNFKEIQQSTAKAFAAHLKYFLQAHPNPETKEIFNLWKKSLRQPARYGSYLNNIANIMQVTSDPESLTNPDLYDYENMERDPWSFDPEHPYMSISPSLQYNILNGNIRFGDVFKDLSDSNERKYLQAVFKFNPSWMDAFNFAINPVESIGGRLIPPISNLFSSDSPTDYILNSVPVLSTNIQRYQAVPNRLESVGWFEKALMLEPSIFGTTNFYPVFDLENLPEDASEQLVSMWYAQAVSNNWTQNPYDYYPEFDLYNNDLADAQAKSEVEKTLGKLYAIYKNYNLPEEYNPYTRYPELAEQAYQEQLSRYGYFDPENVDPEASRAAVSFWYKDYKERNLPYIYNPYQYYPQYSVGTGNSTYKKTPNTPAVNSSTTYQDLKKSYEDYYTYPQSNRAPATEYYTQQRKLNSYARPRNFYKDMYTSTGLSRMELRVSRATPKNIQYKAQDIKYGFKRYFRYYY